ncbi:MAG: DUF1320 domain-containing protein [Azonexus sp.]|jgi:phage gp36-like protein|nr:DUF1320 domain-containing protein [Azonexus sp.]
MAFATRADLLARCNAQRLKLLAVPADRAMLDSDTLRRLIEGGDASALDAEDQQTAALALDAIDKALDDANALLLSYGIPATVESTLLARLSSTVAIYYLQGAERMTEEVQRAYDGVIKMLTAFGRGELDLLPPDAALPAAPDDPVVIESAPPRYRGGVSCP